LLLMIHGWGGDEDSMWVFAHGLPRDFWIVAPRAPYAVDAGGYSWWPRDSQQEGSRNLEDLEPLAQDLMALVDTHSLPWFQSPHRVITLGFSQGAAVAAAIALVLPGRVEKAAILSGFLPGGLEGALESKALNQTAFLIAHGTEDELIEISRARDAARVLRSAGAAVVVCEDAVGHKVSAQCLRRVHEFLKS
jgi:phospholipase/carboxylesterase